MKSKLTLNKLAIWLSSACIALTVIVSCKKDQTVNDLTIEQKIENAKKWYEQQADQSKVYLKSVSGDSLKFVQEPQWDKLETATLPDNSFVITMPVKTNLSTIDIGLINQNLVITFNNGYIQSRFVNIFAGEKDEVVKLSPKTLYEIAFLNNAKANKQDAYHNQIVNANVDLLSSTGVKPLLDKPKDRVTMDDNNLHCSEWYLITTYYDGYGNIIGQSEQYLGTTCRPRIGAPEDQPAPGDWGSPLGDGEGSARDIVLDTSITNNPKLNCLLRKLLGLDGTNGNTQMKALLASFVGKGFDVTFKIGSTKPDSWGEAVEDVSNPTRYNIVLNRNRINEGYQMDWVKTMLHEAFHANLLQKTYELFGASAIALWDKNPGSMSFNELMDYTSMKAATSGNPVLKVEHHNFMAANFEVIRDGLKSFSLNNNPNHSDYNDFHFDALAYQGLTGTSHYLNNVIKNPDGSLKTVTINGHESILENVHKSYFDSIRKENIPCN